MIEPNPADIYCTPHVESALLTIKFKKLSTITGHHHPEYYIAAGLLVFTSLVAITLSILATRPSISSGRFTEEDIRNKKTNLLFFGNFHKMQLTDYQWGMHQMVKDREYLYNTMMMDIYYLGVVLAKKIPLSAHCLYNIYDRFDFGRYCFWRCSTHSY